jgi:hypothetical protein
VGRALAEPGRLERDVEAGAGQNRWFLGSSVGNYIGGRLAAFYETLPLHELFGIVAAIGVAVGIIMLLLAKPITKLEGRTSN